MAADWVWSRIAVAISLAVTAVILAACGRVAPAAADDAAWLYDPGAVARISITVEPDAAAAIEADPDTYQPAQFSIEGTEGKFGPLTVGLRLKGHYSFRPLTGKAAFKVKFDKFVKKQRFQGLEKMTLNNMVQDPSMVHETLAYEAFRAAGVPAPRTGYAYVTVNGEEFGLYLDIESLDKVSLPHWFGSTQHLYEAGYETDVIPGGASEYEVDEGEADDRSDLEALIAAANDDEGDWSDGMAAVADLGEMVREWAAERYIGHWDGYTYPGVAQPNNYYLQSEDSGLFRMIPWGTDQAWERHPAFDEPSHGVLFNRCLADQSCAAMYREAVADAAAAIEALDLDSRVEDLADLLAPWEDREPSRETDEHSRHEIDEGVDATANFLAARPAEAAAWLAEQPPEEEAPPPEDKTTPDPGPGEGPLPPASLRVGGMRATARAVASRVVPSGAGALSQRGTAAGRDRPRVACRGAASSSGAVGVPLRCRLADWAYRATATGALPLTVRTCFAPDVGSVPVCQATRVVVPRRIAKLKIG